MGTTKLMTAGGGGVNIQPASSIASDVTVNVPSQNCTLGIQGPAFSAYLGTNQSISSATQTKAQINTEEFDTANCFDTSNYRFTPTVAGYYQVSGCASCYASTSPSRIFPTIYKNGVEVKRFNDFYVPNSPASLSQGSALVYLNGTTDYIELYVFIAAGTAVISSGAVNCNFQAVLVRAA